jgi:hypothetical protein
MLPNSRRVRTGGPPERRVGDDAPRPVAGYGGSGLKVNARSGAACGHSGT